MPDVYHQHGTVYLSIETVCHNEVEVGLIFRVDYLGWINEIIMRTSMSPSVSLPARLPTQ